MKNQYFHIFNGQMPKNRDFLWISGFFFILYIFFYTLVHFENFAFGGICNAAVLNNRISNSNMMKSGNTIAAQRNIITTQPKPIATQPNTIAAQPKPIDAQLNTIAAQLNTIAAQLNTIAALP